MGMERVTFEPHDNNELYQTVQKKQEAAGSGQRKNGTAQQNEKPARLLFSEEHLKAAYSSYLSANRCHGCRKI